MFVIAAEIATNRLDYDTSITAPYSLVDAYQYFLRKTLLHIPEMFLKSQTSYSFENYVTIRNHNYGDHSVELNRHENLTSDIT
jgi:hypothetical protein